MTTARKPRGHISLRQLTADRLRRFAERGHRSMSSVLEEVLEDLPPAPSELAATDVTTGTDRPAVN